MKNDEIYRKRRKLFIITLAVLVIGTGIFLTLRTRGSTASETSPEYVRPDGPTAIARGEELYKQLNNDKQFSALRTDLTAFANLTFSKEEQSKMQIAGIVFEVYGDVTILGQGAYSFSGKYDGSSDMIDVLVNALNNDRIKTSITNTRSKESVDNQLPSNSRRNQFIGNLPLTQNNFAISYISSSDSFLITAYDRAGEQAAKKSLSEGLGVQTISEDEYNVITSTDDPGGVRGD